MKFLSKKPTSEILKENLTYRKGADNSRLRDLLLEEQKNFCAYTETYIQNRDSVEVEHFNAAKKYNDDYFNYYTALRSANQNKAKKDNKYRNASFHTNLFFQDINELNRRIRYNVLEQIYEEVDTNDTEASELIDLLGLRDYGICEDRRNHIKRLHNIFTDNEYDKEKRIEYFRNHKGELSFITALELVFELDLSEFYQ